MQLDNHKHLLSRIGTTCKHHKEISRLSGADFNVFKIINVTYDEVKHSAFLAQLLNPKGSHGQGDLFLKLFVKKIGIESFQSDKAIVELEKHIGFVTDTSGGFIDIFIDDQSGNKITIENKLYASDQDYQLIRYYNYNKQNLFYLTLNGVNASNKSTISKDGKLKLKAGTHYNLLAYDTHILNWLEDCHKETASMPLLREGISHYINLIKFITGTSINKAMQKEIVELITESPTNLANASELASNWITAKTDIQWKFWEAMKAALIKLEFKFEETENTVTKEKVLNCYRKNFAERYTCIGFYSLIYQKGDVTIRWGCEVNQNIYFGFKIWDKGKVAMEDTHEIAEIRKEIADYAINPNITPGWLGWQFVEPKLNFYEFNSETIFNLVNKNVLEKTVQIIAERAQSDIAFVKSKLAEMELSTPL